MVCFHWDKACRGPGAGGQPGPRGLASRDQVCGRHGGRAWRLWWEPGPHPAGGAPGGCAGEEGPAPGRLQGPGHPLLVDEVRLGHHQASSLSPMYWPEVLALPGPPTLAWPFLGICRPHCCQLLFLFLSLRHSSLLRSHKWVVFKIPRPCTFCFSPI